MANGGGGGGRRRGRYLTVTVLHLVTLMCQGSVTQHPHARRLGQGMNKHQVTKYDR